MRSYGSPDPSFFYAPLFCKLANLTVHRASFVPNDNEEITSVENLQSKSLTVVCR